MKILIVGAGQVGKSVMHDLLEDHSISLVDKESSYLDDVPFEVEVTAGDGLQQTVLEDAGLNDTDLVITTTSDDQTNLLICNLVKVLTESYTIARVSDPSFVDTRETAKGAFGGDALIGRANLTANEITDLVGYQASPQEALSEQRFAQGQVKMSEFELTAESPLLGLKVENATEYEDLTFGSIQRDGDFMIAKGDLIFQEGDRIVVLVLPKPSTNSGSTLPPPTNTPSRTPSTSLAGGCWFSYGLHAGRDFPQRSYLRKKPRTSEIPFRAPCRYPGPGGRRHSANCLGGERSRKV